MDPSTSSEQINHSNTYGFDNNLNSFVLDDNEFYELELRETKLKILKRYTDINVIGAGAQGLVL